MYIHEYQAKQLLKENGIPVPAGGVATSVDEALDVARNLDSNRFAIKAQVYAGGRGAGHFRGQDPSKGGVRIVVTLDEVQRNSYDMLGQVLVTEQTGEAGRKVERIYIERACDVKKEFYLALTIDSQSDQLTLLVSASGGSNIESVAGRQPDSIQRINLGIDTGPTAEDLSRVSALLQLEGGAARSVEQIVQSMHRMFVSLDLSLIEINPLALTRQGELLALDAVLKFDDNALFRHPDIRALQDEKELPVGQLKASVHGINYVKLDGDVGYMANGAGLALATLDAIKHAGGEPANFLDAPPVVRSSVIKDAFLLLASDPGVKSILVNVFGGGIMRCDTVADGILMAMHEQQPGVPVVVRLAGVNAKLGQQRLQDSTNPIRFAGDLTEAANMAVEAAKSERIDDRSSWWQRARNLIQGG